VQLSLSSPQVFFSLLCGDCCLLSFPGGLSTYRCSSQIRPPPTFDPMKCIRPFLNMCCSRLGKDFFPLRERHWGSPQAPLFRFPNLRIKVVRVDLPFLRLNKVGPHPHRWRFEDSRRLLLVRSLVPTSTWATFWADSYPHLNVPFFNGRRTRPAFCKPPKSPLVSS